MDRRRFLGCITGGVVAAPLTAPAQQPKVLGAPPVGTTSLGWLVKSMPVGSWAELVSANIDDVLGVGSSGDSEISFPFTNSMPWCPLRRKAIVISMDHGYAPGARHMEYDDASNAWAFIGNGPRGMSHGYQHVAVNPFNGDIYARDAGSTIARYTNGAWALAATHPESLSQVIAIALTWCDGIGDRQGRLAIYNGNSGSVQLWNPADGSWKHVFAFPGAGGQYGPNIAYSVKHNCLVVTPGAPFSDPSLAKRVFRVNADHTATQMPDAPFHPFAGGAGNLVSDYASGNVLLCGYGQLWELDVSGVGAWTQKTPPPAEMRRPDAGWPFMGIDCRSHGVVLYVDGVRGRKPKCRMWVYKHARV